jgi:serine/threonine-protein kinase
VALALTSVRASQTASAGIDQRLTATARVARRFVEAEGDKLASGAAVAVQIPPFVASVLSGDPSTALDQAQVWGEVLGADFTMFVDVNTVVLARTDRPTEAGDTLGNPGPLIGQALEGRQVTGYLSQDDARLYLAVATPMQNPPVTGSIQAAMVTAHQVTDSLAADVKRASGSEIVFYVITDTEGGGYAPVVVASTMPRSPGLDSAIAVNFTPEAMANDTLRARVEVQMGEGRYVGFNSFLKTPGAEGPVGGYVALRSLAAEAAGFRALQRTLVVVGIVGLLLALVASWLVASRIARPVRALVGLTRRVADGDYETPVEVTSRDEIGQLAAAFRKMVEELQAKQQLVEYLSGSDQATQPVYTAGGDVASATMVRSVAAGTGMVQVGQVFAGRYEVKSILGMGGMGIVYRAWDTELGEAVAIKTLKGDAMASDPALLARFKDEIRLARKITHRNVVRTHDIGEADGTYYITMEFVEGQSLKHLIQSRGHLPVNVVLTVGKQLCRALEVAHEQGVIHRDIKPQNLIVEPSGVLKVMDFGIARLATRTDGVTQAGMAIGTPEYMAPEQLLGGEVDFRVDLYATGCVLFECLTGRTPFVADSPVTLVAKQLEEVPPSPASLNTDVPEPLARLVLRTLSKDPAARPAGAAALHDELEAIVV